MKLPANIIAKLDKLKEHGAKIKIEFVIAAMEYKTTIDGEVQYFRTDDEFYAYLDKKINNL